MKEKTKHILRIILRVIDHLVHHFILKKEHQNVETSKGLDVETSKPINDPKRINE